MATPSFSRLEIDRPHALRYAESVSVSLEAHRALIT